MKWYNKSHYSKALTDIGMNVKLHKEAERYVMRYSKLALKFMRNQNCEEQVTGTLNLQDVMQICFEGLVQAWNRVDWDKLDKKENFQKALVNYLSSEIKHKIKHRIYKEATGVNTPRHVIDRTKHELAADKLFGNWMYNFKLDDILSEDAKIIRYIDMIYWDPSHGSSHDNDTLNQELSDLMFKYLNDKERQIIRWNYGLDDDKLTSREIGDKLGMHEGSVRKTMQRAIAKLNNHESEIILKDFL